MGKKAQPVIDLDAFLAGSAAQNHSTDTASELASLSGLPPKQKPPKASPQPVDPTPASAAPTEPTPTTAPAEPAAVEEAPVQELPPPAPSAIATPTETVGEPEAETEQPVVAPVAATPITATPAADNQIDLDWLWQSPAESRTQQFRISSVNKEFLHSLAQVAPHPITPTELLENIVTEFRNRHKTRLKKLLEAYYRNQLKKVR